MEGYLRQWIDGDDGRIEVQNPSTLRIADLQVSIGQFQRETIRVEVIVTPHVFFRGEYAVAFSAIWNIIAIVQTARLGAGSSSELRRS